MLILATIGASGWIHAPDDWKMIICPFMSMAYKQGLIFPDEKGFVTGEQLYEANWQLGTNFIVDDGAYFVGVNDAMMWTNNSLDLFHMSGTAHFEHTKTTGIRDNPVGINEDRFAMLASFAGPDGRLDQKEGEVAGRWFDANTPKGDFNVHHEPVVNNEFMIPIIVRMFGIDAPFLSISIKDLRKIYFEGEFPDNFKPYPQSPPSRKAHPVNYEDWYIPFNKPDPAKGLPYNKGNLPWRCTAPCNEIFTYKEVCDQPSFVAKEPAASAAGQTSYLPTAVLVGSVAIASAAMGALVALRRGQMHQTVPVQV